MEKLNLLSEKIIGCAIEVHRNLGPGLLESIYEKALCYELGEAGLICRTQVVVPIFYKGTELGEHRIDLLVEDSIILELKAVEKIDPIFKAQLLSYLKITGLKLGLLLNFNVHFLKDGITRVIL
jgi:GxxExxY protein